MDLETSKHALLHESSPGDSSGEVFRLSRPAPLEGKEPGTLLAVSQSGNNEHKHLEQHFSLIALIPSASAQGAKVNWRVSLSGWTKIK